MLKLKKEDFNTIQMQMFNKARDIDVAIFNYLFLKDLPKMFVITALTGYQNTDGGFAHALEIDNYNKDSSSYQCYEALRILYECKIENMSEDKVLEGMLKKMFNYLYNRLTDWCAVIPSNDNAVCASWFKYSEANKKLFGDAPAPAILGYTIHFTDEKNPYYKMAMKKIPLYLNKLNEKNNLTKEEFISYKTLISILDKKGLFKDEINSLKEIIYNHALKMVERDSTKFGNYTNLPLEMFDDYTTDEEINKLIDENLDFLINNIPSHGLWEASFDWMNEYPEASTASIKWMGVITIRNLLWLEKFKRLEG